MKNFGIAISAQAALQFRNQGITDPANYFLGKTIRVKGCIMRFENRLYLPVLDSQQVDIFNAP